MRCGTIALNFKMALLICFHGGYICLACLNAKISIEHKAKLSEVLCWVDKVFCLVKSLCIFFISNEKDALFFFYETWPTHETMKDLFLLCKLCVIAPHGVINFQSLPPYSCFIRLSGNTGAFPVIVEHNFSNKCLTPLMYSLYSLLCSFPQSTLCNVNHFETVSNLSAGDHRTRHGSLACNTEAIKAN